MAAATKLGTVSHGQCLWGTAWPLENMWRKHVSAEHKKAQKGFPLVEQDWIGPSVVFNLSKEQGMIEDTIMCCDIPVAGFHDLKWAALSLGFLPHNVAPIKHGSTASTGATTTSFWGFHPLRPSNSLEMWFATKKEISTTLPFWTTRRPSPSRFWVESSSQMFEVRQSYPTFLLDVLTKTESRISVGFWSISSRGKLLIHGNWNQCQVLHIFTVWSSSRRWKKLRRGEKTDEHLWETTLRCGKTLWRIDPLGPLGPLGLDESIHPNLQHIVDERI